MVAQPEIVVIPIGLVRSSRLQPEDDSWDRETSRITLSPHFPPEVTLGLESFSHIEVVFHFDRAGDPPDMARHPRSRKDWPLVGIFAQRGKDRPNRIGVTICRLLSVEGLSLTVRGLDAIDGTPVLDIKPVMTGFLPRGEITEPQWARELMKEYW